MTVINRNKRKTDTGDSEPIDEQEQDEIFFDMKNQCTSQAKQISKLLSSTCYGSGVFSISTVLFHKFDSEFGLYPVYVTILHFFAGYIAQDLLAANRLFLLLGIIAAILPMLLFVAIMRPTDPWVWGLGGSNIYTMMAVLYMRNDTIDTFNSLAVLEDSKYKHKSL